MTWYDDAMRTIIDLPPAQLEALDALCRHEGISRAEGVRRAVASHVQAHQPSTRTRAFGLWQARRLEGVAYQRRLRREWDR
jgi:metal-responsive CopG/Arc/MetJ family transcriptional regulator